MFESVESTARTLAEADYVADTGLATSLFLALKMGKAVFVEGEPGVGKTEIAKVLSRVLQVPLIRLQCYEGLDVSQAVYEWNYPKQLLVIQARKESGAEVPVEDILSEAFLLRRPLLQAIDSSLKICRSVTPNSPLDSMIARSACNASTPFSCGSNGYCDYTGRCQTCAAGMANCDGQSNNMCEAPASACTGGTGGTWDVTLVSVSVTPKDASNSDWDTIWGTNPLPDVYVYVSAGGIKFAHSRTQANTTYAQFEETLLTGLTTTQLTGNGLSISVRDEDAPGGYPYNSIGSCNYKLYATSGTSEQIVACGPQVLSLKLRFTRR